ncbi:MAG: cell wall-active antibiotics response protein [Ignavibacteria bacterium]|jgi:predicted membrane protein|nr:cell wall-active antibiotics response protein [Ignavibacteria bacterium]MCU7503664.1 cell wall-active antibiotics response protein [Ignavibacteria bacterium]MCU7517853.1 cell wall-active antibiotics response protein [Ignavibacteria bacterium]
MSEIRRRSGRTFLLGTIIVALGIILLLSNLHMLFFPLGEIVTFPQGILLLIGIILIANGNYRGGSILIMLGVLFWASDHFNYDFWTIWPVLLIILGLYILFGIAHPRRRFRDQAAEKIADHVSEHFKSRYYKRGNPVNENFLDETAIFSGIKKSIASEEFQGGRITSIFGGSEIDLYNCKLAPGNNILEVTAIFGGTTLYIPRDWKVIVEATPILGGFSDERRKDPGIAYPEDRKLIIRGLLLFGGGEIKTA